MGPRASQDLQSPSPIMAPVTTLKMNFLSFGPGFVNMQHATKKGSKRTEMIIKTVNEFKLMRADIFTAGQKSCGKKGLGHQVSGPPDSRGLQSAARWPAFRNTSNISNIRSFVIHLQITSTKL